MRDSEMWPKLSEARDGATIRALHLYSQLVGKVATALLPWRNHGWHLTLHVTPNGLRTEPLHADGGAFELMLDLVNPRLLFVAAGRTKAIDLTDTSVAQTHANLLVLLRDTGCPVALHDRPNEIEPATPFAEDRERRTLDCDSARRLLGALVSADRVLRQFRSGFLGKASPVHFF